MRMVRWRGYCPPIVTGVTGRRTSQRGPVRPNTLLHTPSQRNTNSSDQLIVSQSSLFCHILPLQSSARSILCILSFLKESYINEQLHYSFSSLKFSSDWAGRLFYCCSQKTNFSTFTAKPPPLFLTFIVHIIINISDLQCPGPRPRLMLSQTIGDI